MQSGVDSGQTVHPHRHGQAVFTIPAVTGVANVLLMCCLCVANFALLTAPAVTGVANVWLMCSQEALRACMSRHGGSLVVEIQQRALEYSALSHLDR